MGLTPAHAEEKEGEAEEMIADVHAQSERANDRVEISTTTLSELQDPKNVNSEQIESVPADGESMDYDEMLSEDEYPEARTDDDDSLEKWAGNSSNDEFAEFEWLEPLDVTVTCTGGTVDVT